MDKTERGRYQFRRAEHVDGTPWIMTNPLKENDQLNSLGPTGFIGFDLKPGTSYEEAQRIAEYLERHIEMITIAR